MRTAVLLVLAAALVAAAPAAAAPTLVKVGDFAAPTYVTSPPNDARLFVTEQGGRVRVASGGTTKTFLDNTSLTNSGGNEQGLLSIAFAPDYAASGLLYIAYTRGDRALQVDELRRSSDPDAADTRSRRPVLTVAHADATNHNGGQLQFGRDGLLYVSTGDGGGSNDPGDDAASTASQLGKILRINPRGAAPVNPFENDVWAYGLRNPWRFSFDRANGDLVIADVGQGHREEIDWAPASAGAGRGVNFGWRCWEGKMPTPQDTDPGAPESPALCTSPPSGTAAPLIDFTHEGDGFCSITGGFVVRDPGLPTLAGRYLYTDFCDATLRSLQLADPATDAPTGLTVPAPTSFGEDACGRIYVASRANAVYRLEDGAATPCAFGPGGTGGGTGRPAADTRKPKLTVRVRGLKTLVDRRRLRIALQTDERTAATLTGRLR